MDLNLATSPAGVSVVICCYNSAARLPETLRHLARQNVPASIPWEVIVVVDKASTDDTSAVTARIWQEAGAPAPLRLLEESKPGKTPALETGFVAANYSVLIIVDDDNWLNPDYLERAFNLMQEHPEVGAIGGKITAAFEVGPPAWFQQFHSAYAVGAQGKNSGDITAYKPHVAGAGMVVRKSAYEMLKQRGYRPLLSGGRRGNLTAGDDLELCYALVLSGHRIWYDEVLCLSHFMPKGRLTQSHLLEMMRRNRIAGPRQVGYEIALRGGEAKPLRFYLHRVRLLGWWLAKDLAKFLLGRKSWIGVRIAFADWIQSLFDYGVLRRVIRENYADVHRLKQNRPAENE